MPAAPIIVAAAVGSGAAAALGAAVVGAITTATISTAVATAVGVGVISGVSTAVQGGSSSDILRSAVVGGVSSYVGGQVASKVTSAVASQTGASLVDLEPSLRALSGEGATAAGIASITAGNVAGAATSAAITGQPIDQAALFGLAQSIPTALSGSQDFRSLNPVVQNVLASSAQAAVMGQDVGDAAIASLVASSGIVARAINEIPGGQEFIRNNPVYAKYVIDSVSSALTAQLQGKDVSESVIYSLARTTADVLSQEFQNSQKAKEVEDANAKYAQAQQVEQETLAAQQQLNDLVRRNQRNVDNYNYYKDRYNYVYKDLYQRYDRIATEAANSAQRMRDDPFWMFYEGQFGRTPEYYDQIAEQNRQQRDVFIGDVNEAVAGLNQSYEKLQAVNFFDEYKTLNNNFQRLNRKLTTLTNDIQAASQNLTQSSADLFTGFETELATTLAPLTAFEDVTGVGDQDVLAEIQPVAPPTQITGLDPTISAQAEDIAREEFAKVAQGEQVAALPAVAIPAAANVLTRTAIQAAPAVVRRVTQFAANDPRFAQAVVENPYIQELLRAASLTAAIGQNGELLIQPIIQQNESAAETARLYRYATEVQSQAVNIPPQVVQALDREARRFEELAMQEDIENLLAPQPDMEVELAPEIISPTQPIPEIDVRPAQPAITPSPVEIPQVVPEEVSPLPELLPGIVPQPQPIPAPAPRPSQLPQPLPEPASVPAQEPARRTDVEVAPIPAEELGLLPQTRPAEEPMPRPAAETAPQVRPEEPQPITRPVDFPEDITDDEIMRIIEEDLGEPLDLSPEEEEAAPEEEGVETPEPAPTTEGEEGAEPSPEILLPSPVITTVGRRTFQRPGEVAPYRVTGMDESGILGRKQPLFGGDEDLQRAEWNRRSLRLRRLLGL